jgi:hypothetical protein
MIWVEVLCSERKVTAMQYHFVFVPAPKQFEKQFVQHFAEGDMPIIPAIGDKIEYGYPAIPAKVVDREIRFHGGSPDNEIHIVLFVEERNT